MSTVPHSPPGQSTWNDSRAIAEHRRMTAAECLAAAIALSRAAVAFAGGPRDGE
ncbi:MAG: hypothetical protein H0T43_07495 [Solirubrobacterales bacterium]|nr:hypothetical protein [Solirubrobacterales bacterium]